MNTGDVKYMTAKAFLQDPRIISAVAEVLHSFRYAAHYEGKEYQKLLDQFGEEGLEKAFEALPVNTWESK